LNYIGGKDSLSTVAANTTLDWLIEVRSVSYTSNIGQAQQGFVCLADCCPLPPPLFATVMCNFPVPPILNPEW
jgi:hypothetical protein